MPPVKKQDAPGNDPRPVDAPADQAAPGADAPTLASPAATNPDVVSSTDGVGLSAGEMQEQANTTYHDSLSGRKVDADGNFLDATGDEGPIPAHRIVADNWPEFQGSSAGRVEDPHAEGIDDESAHGTR